MEYILSIDQGTSSTRTIIFDKEGKQRGSHQVEHKQYYPKPAWVEHDPMEIWDNTELTMRKAIEAAGVELSEIHSIGITNQRETVVAWDKSTGLPLHNAIVWQCRRTAPRVDELSEFKGLFHEKTGLVLDAYFSGTKMEWLLQNSPKVQEASQKGTLAFGTIDSWLMFKMSGRHVTEASNASRTLLYNIRTKEWDTELMDILGVNPEMLPEVLPNADDPFGHYKDVPIGGVLGDQQAALFGQLCFNEGQMKNTYGTGNFTLLNTGKKIVHSSNGLLTTVAWDIGGDTNYALEGSVFVTGAALRWLRDNLNFFDDYSDIDGMASESNNGVYFVPAFVGLGAPHWDSNARGTLLGITGSASKGDIVRATLESIAFQTEDLLELMREETKLTITELRVDGGQTNSELLMQIQADISQLDVAVPRERETTALGAAFMAGLNRLWENPSDLGDLNPTVKNFSPKITEEERRILHEKWKEAVTRSLSWL